MVQMYNSRCAPTYTIFTIGIKWERFFKYSTIFQYFVMDRHGGADSVCHAKRVAHNKIRIYMTYFKWL